MRYLFHQYGVYPDHDVQMIPRSRRLAVIPHLVFGAMACFAALFDQDSFTNPVYNSLFEFVALEAWGLGFGASAGAAFVVLLTGSFRAYVFANLTMLFMSTSWLLALIKARFVDGYDVTALAFGLWIFVVATCVVNAAIPVAVVEVKKRDPAA